MNIRKLAAIDIGSNGIRMLINFVYEFPGQEPIFNKTSLVRMPIRLGKDVFTEKKISDKSAERMLEAIKAYKLMMDIYGVEDYLAFATSAMREAENGKEIIKKIRKKTGIKIKVIDGETESKLIFASELSRFVQDQNNYLYVDVGGGSTELTLIKNNKVCISKSFEVGTVRLMEKRVESEVYPAMKKWIEENIRKFEVDLIGSGGNINHVYKYSGIKLGRPMPANYVRKHFRIIREMSYEDRLRDFNMKTDRADVIEYALEIYVKVLKWTHSKRIFVPKIGISDGMIRSLYEEISNE